MHSQQLQKLRVRSSPSSLLKNPGLPKKDGGNGVPPSKIMRLMTVMEGAALSAPIFRGITLDQLPEWDTVLGLQFENLIVNNVTALSGRGSRKSATHAIRPPPINPNGLGIRRVA